MVLNKNFDYNLFVIVEDIVAQIIPGVTSLKLSGNSYGIEAAAAIGEALSHVPSLKQALWSDMFVSRLKTEIPPALVRCMFVE